MWRAGSYIYHSSFAYTVRGVGAVMAAIGVPAVAFLVERHVSGAGYNITNGAVHLGRLYYPMLAVFGLLALAGLLLFWFGLYRLAVPGTLAWRLTRLRR